MKSSLTAFVVVALAAAACDGETPKPTQVDSATAEPRPRIKRNPEPDDPYHNPDNQRPKGREPGQLSPAELDEALAQADVELAAGREAEARAILFACANREPPSGLCDAKMALSLAKAKNRRETAAYFLLEAARSDDPKITPELFDQLSEALRQRGELDAAVVAIDKAIAGGDSNERRLARARMLQSIPDRKVEAADALAQLRAKDDSLELLFEEAVLRGQVPEQAAAASQKTQASNPHIRSLPFFQTAGAPKTPAARRAREGC